MKDYVVVTRPGRPDVSLAADDEMDAVSRALDAGLIADDEDGSVTDVVGLGSDEDSE